jgi:hypothetical protein
MADVNEIKWAGSNTGLFLWRSIKQLRGIPAMVACGSRQQALPRAPARR